MPENPIHALLSRILRGGLDPYEYEIIYTHRGAAGDQATVRASDIARLGRGSFVLRDEGGEETQIPFHRILEIRNTRTDVPIWKKTTVKEK